MVIAEFVLLLFPYALAFHVQNDLACSILSHQCPCKRIFVRKFMLTGGSDAISDSSRECEYLSRFIPLPSVRLWGQIVLVEIGVELTVCNAG
jgi:hypothetical protein